MICAVLALFFATGLAEDFAIAEPNAGMVEVPLEEENPKLQAIVVYEDVEALKLPQHLSGVNVFFEAPGLADQLAVFLGQEVCEETVEGVRREVCSYLCRFKKAAIVEAPDQDLTEGALKLAVKRSKIGDVSYVGNDWVSTSKVRSIFDLHSGKTIHVDQLMNTTAWFNRNPFRRAEVVMSPGSLRYTSDIEVVTQDRFPVRVYSGIDNTGTTETDTVRIYAGFNYGDVLGSGDMLTYQFTTAPSFHRYMSHYANYTCFLPWQDEVIFYGAYAEMHPDVPDFRNDAKNIQVSFRYDFLIKPLYTSLLQEVKVGYDYKNLDSALFYTSLDVPFPITEHSVNLTQFFLGYELNKTTDVHELTYRLELLCSPFTWLPNQTRSVYDALRYASNPKYVYGRMALGDIWTIAGNWVFSWLIRGQLSSSALIASEQFGLGGFTTVRGYEENAFLADDALCTGLEIRTPKFSFFRKPQNDCLFLASADIGRGWNKHPAVPALSAQTLCSAGLGFRYNIRPYLMARFDYGFQLHAIPGDDHFGRVHFSLYGGY